MFYSPCIKCNFLFITGKSVRRRAASMETSKYEKRRGRAKKRVEALRSAGLSGTHFKRNPRIFKPENIQKKILFFINTKDMILLLPPPPISHHSSIPIYLCLSTSIEFHLLPKVFDTGIPGINDVSPSPSSSISEGLDLFPDSPLHRYLSNNKNKFSLNSFESCFCPFQSISF